MQSEKVSYSARLLRGGKGIVAWQRLARFRRAAREMQRLFGPAKADVLVDVGAADGIGLSFWTPVAGQIHSINYYHGHSVEFAAAHPERSVMTADVRRLPFPDQSVDIVVSLETLHLLPDRQARRQALLEICRILKPRGILICSVAIEVGVPALIKYAARRATGFDIKGLGFKLMLKHLFHRWCDLARYDKGTQIGFDAYRFADDAAQCFDIHRRIHIPAPYPLCTNLMLAGKPRPPE